MPNRQFAIQIVDTLETFETRVNTGFTVDGHHLNRTVVVLPMVSILQYLNATRKVALCHGQRFIA
jgi:hypothetical protein